MGGGGQVFLHGPESPEWCRREQEREPPTSQIDANVVAGQHWDPGQSEEWGTRDPPHLEIREGLSEAHTQAMPVLPLRSFCTLSLLSRR